MSKETYQGAIPTPKQWGDTWYNLELFGISLLINYKKGLKLWESIHYSNGIQVDKGGKKKYSLSWFPLLLSLPHSNILPLARDHFIFFPVPPAFKAQLWEVRKE